MVRQVEEWRLTSQLSVTHKEKTVILSKNGSHLPSMFRVSSQIFKRAYHPGPSRFGSYPLILSSSAITSYPEPLPVPDHIRRPQYVPSNFFTAPWGEHNTPEMGVDNQTEGERIGMGSKEERDVRMACKVAAEILKRAGDSVVKVNIHFSQFVVMWLNRWAARNNNSPDGQSHS